MSGIWETNCAGAVEQVITKYVECRLYAEDVQWERFEVQL